MQAKRKKKSGQTSSKGPKAGGAARTKTKGRSAPRWTKLDEESGSRDQSRNGSENGDGEEAARPKGRGRAGSHKPASSSALNMSDEFDL